MSPLTVSWLLALVVVAEVAVALRYRALAAAHAKRVKSLEKDHAERTAALKRKINVLEQQIKVQDEGVVSLVANVERQAAERAEKAARAAVKTVTRSVQALVNEQQGAVSALLRRHDIAGVLADANAIDHASSQLGRRAQVLAMLTGSWPGRQRVASPLLDVVRAGTGRIRDFVRIEVNGELPVSVVSQAVEPVALAVAELLDNAARHSEPSSKVQVGFLKGNGVSIVIDDAGVGLKPEDQLLAAKFLSGSEPVLLTQLRSPFRLGFAAVGVLAARYGFKASVAAGSPFGGTRAVLHLPESLLTTATEPAPRVESAPRAAARATPKTMLADVPEQERQHPEQPPQAAGPDGLPRRRRRQPQQNAVASGPSAQTPTDSGRRLSAIVRGRRAAQDQMNPDERNA
ncbi:ATP-binding protein [Streptomyces cucumeris]|uniref:ATP-binding protein n=1 Tax=Streptomyces cucumeris TaxID=2962890 RepID=UPI003D718F25